MASEQVRENEFIVQAKAEATRVAIQTMATVGMARQGNLQTKGNMASHRDEVPQNSIHRPIAFASKSLTGAEKRYR